ncbi:snapalysin [Streptomyces oceani]|uniref:Extracellular small neutral protease n=1 Tax=Streptomyces oceani TaxID=1075402 RepID=A0A1E7KPI9_9ACTN|nr:snapalysin [Streptomyces oceani]OEV05838.1 ABC transporter substrate-binding protein [Streptomyces oceani]
MRHTKTALSGVLGLGLAASLAAVPAAATSSASPAESDAAIAAYTPGSAEDQANTRAFFEAVMKSVQEKQAAEPGIQAVTVTYDASGAPTFAQEIANSTQIWNSSVDNVTLQEGSGGDFEYREGNDPRGSYASTDGHGNGYIFLDYAQNQEYDSTRVTTHETGHVLGLPDNYSGPCSELMSGGGPGPSCTNAQPNAQEAARVEQLWANGLKDLELAKAAFVKAH